MLLWGVAFAKAKEKRRVSLVMVTVTLLGTAQDGGRPQAGCQLDCCRGLSPDDYRYPVSLGILDQDGNGHIIEATRSLADQLNLWKHPPIHSVALTHAHFGHVDGLGLFGKETLNAKGLALYLSSSMQALVEATPQWNLMVNDGVFVPQPIVGGHHVRLGEGCLLEAVEVPHRAELSDMHAFIIRGPNRSLLFLPDHDRWSTTLAFHESASIRAWLNSMKVDIALIDGTFWSADELSGRNQGEVPHPPVSETIQRLGQRRADDPEIHFIHLNHTNPLHEEESTQYHEVTSLGWGVAQQGMTFTL